MKTLCVITAVLTGPLVALVLMLYFPAIPGGLVLAMLTLVTHPDAALALALAAWLAWLAWAVTR